MNHVPEDAGAGPGEASDGPGETTGGGRLAENVLHFARVLRAAGMPLGTDRILLALDAVRLAGLASRADFHGVLMASLLERVEHRDLFEQAFHVFWRDQDLLGRMLDASLSDARAPHAGREQRPASRRLAQALSGSVAAAQLATGDDEAPPDQAPALAASASERLRKADFDSMSIDEWLAARRAIALWHTQFPRLPTRRLEPAARGTRLDWRRIAARSARRGGELSELRWRRQRQRPMPMVALVDISGSMRGYSRMFMHFLHAMTSADRRTASFVFGTRLTQITRMLRNRDPDQAIDSCVRAVDDWSGGTRIADSLREFNLRWSRRVLGQNALVVLVTDGLERDDARQLAFEIERLSKSCHRLVWLNPLLRYAAFEPRAAGIKAILPHVDAHLPVHNLESLDLLAAALCALGRHPRPESRSRT